MDWVWSVAGLTFLALGSYRAARVWFRLPSGLPAVLGTVVLGWTWLSLSVLALGLTGNLTRVWLLASSVLAFVTGLYGTRNLVADEDLEPSAREKLSLGACIALGFTLWSILSVSAYSLMFPVEVASDGPIYHLYFAAKWWKAERIFLVPTPFGESAAPYFPAVGDLWHTWLFVMWGGDRLARIGQIPFLFVAAGAIYGLCRKAQVTVSGSMIATCCFFNLSPLMFFTSQPNVDTLFIAGYLLACYFASHFLLGDHCVPSVVLCGLAAGAAWGCKAPGIVFIPTLLGCIGFAVLRADMPVFRKLQALTILAMAPFVLEGYWLVRNWMWTNNPLYPLDLKLGGREILRGWYSAEVMPTSKYYIPFKSWQAFIDLMMTVFDPRLVPFWIAGLTGFWAIGRSRKETDRLIWCCAGLALLNIALYWLVIPYRTQQRFMLHATGLAAIPLAALLDRGKIVRALVVTALVFHILTPEGWPLRPTHARGFWDLTPQVPNFSPSPVRLFEILMGFLAVPGSNRPMTSTCELLVGLGSVVLGLTLVWNWRMGWQKVVMDLFCATALFIAMCASVYWENKFPVLNKFPNFPDYLHGWVDLDLRVPPSGTRIAYAGTNLPYYLMGPDFRSDVFYININKQRNWRPHDFHAAAESLDLPSRWDDTRPGWDRAYPDYDAWLANLRAADIKLLVVTRADPTEGVHNVANSEHFTIERVWADLHPETFTLLYGDNLFKIYSVAASENR